MPTQSLSSPSHHAAPAHQPPAALRATGAAYVFETLADTAAVLDAIFA